MKKRIANYLASPIRMSVLNGILLATAIAFNSYIQVFCIPVNWAIILLTVCFTNSVLLPIIIKKEKYLPIISFINGISFCIFIYCVIFLEYMNFYGVLMILAFGSGLITYIPHFFAIQLFWKGYLKQSSKVAKWFFILGITISVLISIVAYYQYKKAIADIKDFEKSGFTELNKTFMTERILGIGIIYHTEFCGYDGWRPPKHDPILNIGHWLNGSKYPIRLDLKDRVRYYREFFPNKKVKFNCSCASEYSEVYHNDKIWK